MARYLFGSDLILTAPSAADVQLAANAPFTLWSERIGGVQLTDCTAPDGATPLLTDDAGNFLADGSGQRPALRGPDGVVLMWVDTGSGVRYAIAAADLLGDVLIAAIQWLQGIGIGSGGGGLPVGTTLNDIPNGADRLAMTQAERNRLAGLPATFLQLGTSSTTAKRGDYAPTPADIGAVASIGLKGRFWLGRTTAQGNPTEAEGAVRGTDYAFLDVV